MFRVTSFTPLEEMWPGVLFEEVLRRHCLCQQCGWTLPALPSGYQDSELMGKQVGRTVFKASQCTSQNEVVI